MRSRAAHHPALFMAPSRPLPRDCAAEVTRRNIHLKPHDLSRNAEWQKISGYSIDLQREITCVMGEPKPPQFWCLLQIYLKNKADGAVKHLAEAEFLTRHASRQWWPYPPLIAGY